MINVRLDDVGIFDASSGRKRDFHGGAQIDRHDVARAPSRYAARVAALAATAFQNRLALEKIRAHRGDPTQELFVVFLVLMRELLPGPAELIGRGLFLSLNIFEISKAGDAAQNLKMPLTLNTFQLAGDNFDSFFLLDRSQLYRPGARRTNQILQ